MSAEPACDASVLEEVLLGEDAEALLFDGPNAEVDVHSTLLQWSVSVKDPNVEDDARTAISLRGSDDRALLPSSVPAGDPNVEDDARLAISTRRPDERQTTVELEGHTQGSAAQRCARINYGVDPRVERHARECHNMDTSGYCQHVFGRTLAYDLHPVTAQVWRNLLTDYKAEQTDASFAMVFALAVPR